MSRWEGPVERTGPLQALEEAALDLVALRAALVAVGTDRGTDLINLARRYWRKHGPTLRLALAVTLNDARSELLPQLYGLRCQIAEQRHAQSTLAERDGNA